MNNYLKWSEKTITDFRPEGVTKMYSNGFVFTRIGKGVMQQTRSLRIDLSKFELTSENRRILKKVKAFEVKPIELPMAVYDISIGKLAKDFYGEKFGEGIMSAQKVKEMLTDSNKSNFNVLLTYGVSGESTSASFAICHSNDKILHYSYPFYDLKSAPKDMGLAMMIKAIQYAKEKSLKYIYLGSLQRPTDTYKLQFDGLEWFDGKTWKTDLEEVKKILTSDNM
jgi:arginyl-tRNA--protein-N-Asp/Glu arginylyltransferase